MLVNIIVDDEFKKLIPPLTGEERKGLEESILKEGCRDALILWGNTLIDGHNRYEICTKHNIPFKTIQKDFKSRDEAFLYMIDNQKSRRNLTAFAKGTLESKAIEIFNKNVKHKKIINISIWNNKYVFETSDKTLKNDDIFISIYHLTIVIKV